MSEDPVIADLSGLPFVGGLTARELRSLSQLVTPWDLEPGQVLAQEGTPGTQAFLIIRGIAAVTKAGRPVGELGPTEFAGEVALVDRHDRSATVTARTKMRVLIIGRQEFSVFTANPAVSRLLQTGLVKDLRNALSLMDEVPAG